MSFFADLSIQRKLLLGFTVISAISVVLGILALYDLSRIRATGNILESRIAGSDYLRSAEIAVTTLEADIERYTTVGGEENRETMQNRLSSILDNARLLKTLVFSPDVASRLTDAEHDVVRLQDTIGQLIILQENGAKRGFNDQIIRSFELLDSIRTDFHDVRKKRDELFLNTLSEQRDLEEQIMIQFIVFEAAIIIVALVLSYFLAQALTEPIVRLRDTVIRVAAGHYEVRAVVKNRDEIGELSASFNAMAEYLQKYTGNLEREVSSRTDQLRKSYEELKAANERLRELDRMKSEFLSVAAHQLRTPLSAMKWTIEALLGSNLDPEQRSLALKGNESNTRMIRLVDDMLAVTRIEAGKVRYAFVPLHPEDVIDSIVLDFISQARVNDLTISFDKSATPLPYMYADPERMRDILGNLIENALRYTPSGGTITIGAAQEGDFVKISVSDSGIGIPPEQQGHIFNKFFRADNAVRVQTDGSGLGLFIVKAQVERHGGHIWFESPPGKGTTFSFTIPLYKEDGPAA